MGSNDKKAIPQPDMKVLYMLSSAKCAKCKKPLYTTQADNSVSNLSEMAHIYGEKPGAARYLDDMTDEERQSYANLMAMCPRCHKEIDDDELTYTPDVLQQMKAEHEQEVIQSLEYSINNVTNEELALTIKFLSKSCTSTVSTDDYTIVTPLEKIKKNNLSPQVASRITMGLAIFHLVQDYINKQSNIDINFAKNLKECFIEKYLEYKNKNLDSNVIFAELWNFAKNGKTDNNSVAAALSVISYFFLECDIFEK